MDDNETVHQIKTIHLPPNTGTLSDIEGEKSDFALVELVKSVNACGSQDISSGRCWPITPVGLPDPDISIKKRQKVRTLGKCSASYSV